MQARSLTIPELVLVAGTRAALGVGVGLLISERLAPDARRGAGWALVLVGALTTIPLVATVFGRPQADTPHLTNGARPAPHGAADFR